MTDTIDRDALDALANARRLVAEPHQWVKSKNRPEGDERDIAGPDCYCVGFAIWKATWRLDVRNAAYQIFGAAADAPRYHPPRHYNIVNLGEWNDAPERTHEQVLAVFDKIESIRFLLEAQ